MIGIVVVLPVVALAAIARVLREAAKRSAAARWTRSLAALGAISLTWFWVLYLALGVSIECVGEQMTIAWTPTIAAVWVGLAFILYGRLAWRWRGEGPTGPSCPACAYSLAGLSLDSIAKCPECGRALPKRAERLYKVPYRRWATRTGSAIMLVGLTLSPAIQVYRNGWTSIIPTPVLLRLVVWNIQPGESLSAFYHRNLTLRDADPHWTLDLMRSFADEYDAATQDGKVPGPMIFNRLYPLYQPSRDPGVLALARQWLTDQSVGRRLTATSLFSLPDFLPADARLPLLRPLLNDADAAIRANALRAMTFDQALPLDELLHLAEANKLNIAGLEMFNALGRYEDPRALRASLVFAADKKDTLASYMSWQTLLRGFDFQTGALRPGVLASLADAKAVLPDAAALRFERRASRLKPLWAAIARTACLEPTPQTASTAKWCSDALASLCAAAQPNGLTWLDGDILDTVKELEAGTPDAALLGRIRSLRQTINPGASTLVETPGSGRGKGP